MTAPEPVSGPQLFEKIQGKAEAVANEKKEQN